MDGLIRVLEEKDYAATADLVSMAYPGMGIQSSEKKQELVERFIREQKEHNGIQYYGCFNEADQLVGIYRRSDFECNINGQFQRIFGIGMVAVHILHKKEKVAFQLLSHFHEEARKEKVTLVALYPFSSSFYRKMGYGYGPIKYEFKIKPGSFNSYGKKDLVQLLSPADEEEIVAVYNKFAEKHHGMMKRTWNERQHIKNAKTRYVGVRVEGQLIGALAFTLDPVKDSNFLHQNLVIHEWVWLSQKAYKQLAAWVHSQQDQVDRVIYSTNNPAFIYSLNNPPNDSNHLIPSVYHEVARTGSGLMYRITEIFQFIEKMNDQALRKPIQNTKIVVKIEDSFIPEQNGLFELSFFNEKWLARKLESEMEQPNIQITIQDLSAWWMGCVSIKELNSYGEVELHNIVADDLDDWFMPRKCPICMTNF